MVVPKAKVKNQNQLMGSLECQAKELNHHPVILSAYLYGTVYTLYHLILTIAYEVGVFLSVL